MVRFSGSPRWGISDAGQSVAGRQVEGFEKSCRNRDVMPEDFAIHNATSSSAGCRSTGRGKKRQQLGDSPRLWGSLENSGRVAKLAPLDERLAGDAGSAVPNSAGMGLKASCC